MISSVSSSRTTSHLLSRARSRTQCAVWRTGLSVGWRWEGGIFFQARGLSVGEGKLIFNGSPNGEGSEVRQEIPHI